MKFFLPFVLLIIAVVAFSSVTNGSTTSDDEQTIQVITEYSNGNIVEQLFSLEDSEDLCSKLNHENMMTCTVQFSSGECSVSASTCGAAMAGFEACACESGHEHFCKDAATEGM